MEQVQIGSYVLVKSPAHIISNDIARAAERCAIFRVIGMDNLSEDGRNACIAWQVQNDDPEKVRVFEWVRGELLDPISWVFVRINGEILPMTLGDQEQAKVLEWGNGQRRQALDETQQQAEIERLNRVIHRQSGEISGLQGHNEEIADAVDTYQGQLENLRQQKAHDHNLAEEKQRLMQAEIDRLRAALMPFAMAVDALVLQPDNRRLQVHTLTAGYQDIIVESDEGWQPLTVFDIRAAAKTLKGAK